MAERLNQRIKKHEYVIKLLDTRNREYKCTSLKEALEKRSQELIQLNEKML